MSPGATTAAVRLMVSGERLAHHPATGGDEHEEEGAEELGEQASPFLRRVLEVLDRFLERLEAMGETSGRRVEQVLAVRRLG